MSDLFEDSPCYRFVTETFLPLKYLVVPVVVVDPTVVVANFVAVVLSFELRVVDELVVDAAEGTLVGFAIADC